MSQTVTFQFTATGVPDTLISEVLFDLTKPIVFNLEHKNKGVRLALIETFCKILAAQQTNLLNIAINTEDAEMLEMFNQEHIKRCGFPLPAFEKDLSNT